MKQTIPQQRRTTQQQTLSNHLAAAGENIPTSTWVRVDSIPPLSSLQAMTSGIEDAVKQQQEKRGILDLDAPWDPTDAEALPFLDLSTIAEKNTDAAADGMIQQAHLILSPFARPTGWYIELTNRSLVYALLASQVHCAWKQVRVQPCKAPPPEDSDNLTPTVTDATVRLENCPPGTDLLRLVNMFSRYDLAAPPTAQSEQNGSFSGSIQRWNVQRLESTNVPVTFLVHFADAAWARAAVRERQSYRIKGKELRLVQYPAQLRK